ncbi:DUF143-domain-containing protein [Conidiobolus coronatus NRRL 28638]|uniref:DUF143-domain-containing protein n=1 Tax=Conidiobolus coronatus (strain ATCC 28846 / CBS 209.66 / NRRL 28638) TaxID=796925 RepID=A0A137NUH4_CONC2|nr:DUF143-domain-containing protein [Conidiobolus coronatus NRRL 28638]|eukprot:KXN66372.1 DUF143-domain-containing protein [Conidiobolus coronatus NRRL 28638]
MKYLILNNSKNLIYKSQKNLINLNLIKNLKFSTNVINKVNNPFHFEEQDNQVVVEKSLDKVLEKVLIKEKLEKGAVDHNKEGEEQEVIKKESFEEITGNSAVDPENISKLEETSEQAIEAKDESAEEVDFWFEEKVEEEFVPMWQRISKDSHMKDAFQPGKLTPELLKTYLENQRAHDIKVINMKNKCDWAEFIVICSVNSSRQLQNLAEKLRKFIKQCQPHDSSIPLKFEVEGDIKDEWLVIDLNSILIHIFLPKTRSEYDIEGIWESIKINPTNPNAANSAISGNFTIEEGGNDNDIEVELKDRDIQKMLGELRDQFIKENRVQLEKEDKEATREREEELKGNDK